MRIESRHKGMGGFAGPRMPDLPHPPVPAWFRLLKTVTIWLFALLPAFIFITSFALITSQKSLAYPLAPAPQSLKDQISVTPGLPQLVPVAIFGKDQRHPPPRKYKKLKSQIGLLHNPRTNTLCTAFCVGSNMIATASHCLFSHRKRRRLHLSDFVFKLKTSKSKRPLYTRLAGYRTRQSRQYIVTGTSRLNRKPPIGAARDWAVIRLASKGCKNGWLKSTAVPYTQLKKASNKKKLFQIAYHMDYRHWQLAYSRSCSVDRKYGGLSWKNIKKHFASSKSLILHRCDTGEASSGSPLLMDSNQGPVVVGINVGTYQQRDIIVKNGRIIRRTKYKTIANTAVSSAAFASSIDFLKQAVLIRKKDDLRKLQSDLKARGYYSGSIDGIYGHRTERAIKAFEGGTRQPIMGLATQKILAKLEESNQKPVLIGTSAGYGTGATKSKP